MAQQDLFSYPSRHCIVEQHLMPTQAPPRGYTQGMADETARAELLELAMRFASLADQALAWDFSAP